MRFHPGKPVVEFKQAAWMKIWEKYQDIFPPFKKPTPYRDIPNH